MHPEPRTAFSLKDWKVGKNSKAIINWIDHAKPELAEDFVPGSDHNFYTVALQETFREQGLQAIVKSSSIELTPEQP